MTQSSPTIEKQPKLTPAEDFYRLRKDGIGFIEQMGSSLWTDYNESDSGIAIHEALCYAITDLAYRIGWDIADLLTASPPAPVANPYPDQTFFQAREILTVNPWTPEDFSRLLIDLDTVRNAWVFCKECVCETSWYAWCDKEQGLVLSYQPPDLHLGVRESIAAGMPLLHETSDVPLALRERAGVRAPVAAGTSEPIAAGMPLLHAGVREVWPLGLYEALLELESDPDTGDLNDRKIEAKSLFEDAGGTHPVTVELRFREAALSDREEWSRFLDTDDAFAQRNGQSFNLKLIRLGATKNYDVLSDPNLDDAGRDSYLHGHWRNIFFLTFEIELLPSGLKIVLRDAALRLFGSTASRDAVTVGELKAFLEERAPNGLIQRYRRKERQKAAAVDSAKTALSSHRNLDEDFCRVKVIGIEEVAVCADVEVTPEADIERVQAQIWFEMENYFNPPVPFYSLQEMMDQGIPVEEIFNGPELESGFLKSADLAAASLKPVLCVSDLINRLMEIEGVIAVNQLQMTKYDAEGNVVKGAADPTWTADGKPVFDPNKVNASWLLYLAKQHQPRLYRNASRFLFYKNGLPFLPRMDEALDTLTQLRGEAERSKIRNAPKDLPAPVGKNRQIEDYFPVQYGFPLTYGIGPDQLPSHASAPRRAQARQLKAYLMVFEQILGNAFAQLAHVADLFSLDTGVSRTYFVKKFTEDLIQGYADLVKVELDQAKLEAMAETPQEFLQRRNRFLDHLLARFGEQYTEFTILLSKLLGQKVALDRLIKDKIAFLKAYPQVSHDRGKAFDYRHNPCAPDNQAGVAKRIALLLGDPDQRMIVVEHLLLRPKFPGDALYPACTEGACATCGAEDPYSFRLTFVMPGWTEPFNTDLQMRDFADRTIREEIPAHLVGKICWVGNDGFVEDLCEPVVTELALLLEEKGKTAGGVRPTHDEACTCAAAIYPAFSAVFKQWYQDNMLEHLHPDALEMQLEVEFSTKIQPGTISCAVSLTDDFPLWSEVITVMVQYFTGIALHGFQFDRFQAAWCKWLEVNAPFDWTEERLQERVEEILAQNLAAASDARHTKEFLLCTCAHRIVNAYGSEFYDWMEGLFRSGNFSVDIALPTFPVDLSSCAGLTFQGGTEDRIRALLEDRYGAYREVSYRLWVVVGLLSDLSNTYPAATLHDCDEGNDKNPVRLGKTALGS